ncbi:MAG: TatD family hydrolase [Steroidobacteraceae bacterium]
MLELIDIGINLTHDSYDHDRAAVLSRALDCGVRQFIVTGASAESSRAAHDLVALSPRILRSTAGCHPHHRNFSSPSEQRRAFEKQLDLAIDTRKPLFLHQRDAHADFIAMLTERASSLPRAVLHCFTGNAAELDESLATGLWIGITGWICDERRGHHLRELVSRIPVGKLMIETDGPYLLPRDLSPKPESRRNEPMYLPHIARVVAAARGETLDELAAHTTRTAREFFEFPAE